MNIYELSAKSRVPLKHLRTLEKLKALVPLDAERDFVTTLRIQIVRNQPLTVPHLLGLLDDPAALDELGAISAKYRARAQAQLDALGDVAATAAPKPVTAAIGDTARQDDDAALVLVDWLKSALPAGRSVGHHWVATRLLFPLNAFLRESATPLITLALLNARKLPEFAGYWRSEKIGGKSVIRYEKPQITLDL